MSDTAISNVERRQSIVQILLASPQPISASALAERFRVSRQVIVGDIAILRAQGVEVISTPKGYISNAALSNTGHTFKVACLHGIASLLEELYAVVDNGGTIVDVIVEHPIYGQLVGQLNISARSDADDFCTRVQQNNALLLSELTDGVHLHTICCRDKCDMQRIKRRLAELNVLLLDE